MLTRLYCIPRALIRRSSEITRLATTKGNVYFPRLSLSERPFLPTRCFSLCTNRGTNSLWSRDHISHSISCYNRPLCVVNNFRGITKFSKKGKRKTCKAVTNRFRRTGSGRWKYWRPGKKRKMLCKSNKLRRKLRKAVFVNKTQQKMLDQMVNGW